MVRIAETTIVARLDKAEARVLCGRQNDAGRYICGGELLVLIDYTPRDLVAAKPGTEMLYDQPRRFWAFRAGWSQDDDGLWRLSPSAAARKAREQKRATGNSLRWSPADRNAARYRLSEGLAESNRRGHGRDWAPGSAQEMRSPTLPTLARCPRCSGVNRIETRVQYAAWPKIPPPGDEEERPLATS